MSINKLLKISAMMAFICMSNQQVFADTDPKKAYNDYLSAYTAYQNAIIENRSEAEIKAALEEFLAAKVIYTNDVNVTSNANYEEVAESGFENVETENNSTRVGLNSAGIARKLSKTPVVAPQSDLQRDVIDLYNKLDSNAKKLVDELRKTQDPKKAAELASKLESIAKAQNNEELANLLKYEVATGLDRLSINSKKVDSLLNELASSKDKRFSKLANENKLYKLAKAKKAAWQNDLQSQREELNNTKSSFKNASWLAFPVKIYRGVKSVSANAKFTYNKSDYETYMIDYEAIQAKFISNVEAVFDEWQAKLKDREDSADVRLVYDNYESWYSRWNLINSAKNTIDVQYFIIESDCFGYSLLGALLEKADAGVKIRLMVDTRGSNYLSIRARGYLVELAKNKNIEVKVYNPITSNVLSVFTDARKVESSNHDKILIVDGKRCITGGRNIAKTYLVNEIDMDDAWRDCDVVISSDKICKQLKQAFDEEFYSMKSYTTDSKFIGIFTSGYKNKLLAAKDCMRAYLANGTLLQPTGDYKNVSSMVKKVTKEMAQYTHMNGYNYFNLLDNSHRCAAHVLDNNSLTGDRKDITENIVKYIDGSRSEIIIQNPYFALTDRAEAALKRASKRGVPIYIHSNSERSSDSAPTEAIVLRDWKKMLTEMPTMRFFARNSDGQLHGKTFNFDRKVAVVGSYNFDSLSEKVNSEIAVAIKSEDFASELRDGEMDDIDVAVEYKMGGNGTKEFAPDDIENGKNKILTKFLSKFNFLDSFF